MLPILATIGAGLAWFATTAGQLVFWGAGIGVGFWASKKLTNTWDSWGYKNIASKFRKKQESNDEEIAAAAAAVTQ
jgi:hypothetical protein